MKLCIIGNSHIACLQNAWRRSTKLSKNHEITFFGAIGGKIAELLLDIEARKLIASPGLTKSLELTSGGHSHIEVDKYEAFLVAGLPVDIEKLVSNFIPENRYSSTVQAAATRDYWEATKLIQIVRKLRSICDAPIFVMHAPLAALLSPPAVTSAIYDKAIFESQEGFFNALPATLIRQPDNTLNGGMATLSKFSSGSMRMADKSEKANVAHSESDIKHMNAEFGEIMLRELWTKLTDTFP